MQHKQLLAAATALAVLPQALALTPEGLISANRYSDAMPNPAGEYALYSVSNYSFDTKESYAAWKKVDLKSGDHSLWYEGEDISEVAFVGSNPDSILYVNATNEAGNGGVSLYSADATDLEGTAKLVASLDAPYGGLKATMTPSGDIHFLVYTQAFPNGTAYNEETATPSLSSGTLYENIYVRHWDVWLTDKRNAVFGGKLTGGPGSWSFDGELTNYVTGMCNVSCAESPYDQSDQSDYDISPDGSGVIFLTKDIDLPRANYTSTQIYYVPFDGTRDDAVPINARGATKYPEAQGASAYPRFSPDGKHVAYVQMNGISYEADRNILYVAKADPEDFDVTRVAGNWDRSPGGIVWSADGKTLYTSTDDLGRGRIFPVPMTAGDDFKPSNITNEGYVAAYYELPNGNWLVSAASIWSSRDMYTVSPEGDVINIFFQSNKVDAALEGLSSADVSEFYYKSNTTEIEQQAFIIYPANFDKTKKYPLCFWPHGGPQSVWANSWSTRWNYKVWADQGYVVIAPNPVASMGWGQNLTDAIQGRWGSYPYWDLMNAWQYVHDNLDYVDTDNGVNAGASFGGYMTNWFQGHEMGRKFKALVTHDGSTSTLNQYASEELWFMNHDFNGPFNETAFKSGSPYYDWNPLLYTDSWATPHFVIHSSLDFRLPISEGVMLYNMLQTKGVPSKFLHFPDESHWVLNQENSLMWHTEIFKFINHYSGISY